MLWRICLCCVVHLDVMAYFWMLLRTFDYIVVESHH